MTLCQIAELSASSPFIPTNDTANWGAGRGWQNSAASVAANPLCPGFPLLCLAWDCRSPDFTRFVFLFPIPRSKSGVSASVLSGLLPHPVRFHPASWPGHGEPQKAAVKLEPALSSVRSLWLKLWPGLWVCPC